MAYTWYITPVHYSEALENGISQDLLTKRVRELGWDIQRAITDPPQLKKYYGPQLAVALKNGITKRAYMQRVNRGWSVERASAEPMKSKSEHGKTIGSNRRIYPKKYIDIAKKNGICYSTFKWRMFRGWTLEEASGIKVMTMSEAGKRRKEGVKI